MYMFRIYATTGGCREITVRSYDYAISRIEHYRKNWPFFEFATLAEFNGVCWVELPILV